MSSSSPRHRFRPRFEQLEDRSLCAIFTVTNGSDVRPGSLRDALMQAHSTLEADDIVFDTSVKTVTLFSLLTISSPQLITINGPGVTIRRSFLPGVAEFQIFRVDQTAQASFKGLTITNGKVTGIDGGGIANGGTTTITDCVITGNETIDQVAFGGSGGGVANFGTLTVINSSITDNIADDGGAISTQDGQVMVQGSILSNNRARRGGAFSNANSGEAEFVNSTIAGNTAEFNGGGFYFSSSGGTITVRNSTVSGNSVVGLAGNLNIRGDGGGFYLSTTGGNTAILNSTVTGNSAAGSGGGIYSDDGTTNIANSTVTLNRADSNNDGMDTGGGVVSAGTFNIVNSIIARNFRGATTAADDIQATVPLSAAFNNIVGDANSAGGMTNGVSDNQVGVDPKLGPLRNNGGRTLTHALLPGSPAIDAASDNILIIFGLMTDQRGLARTQFGELDIGPIEVQPNFFLANETLTLVDTGNVANNVTITNQGGGQVRIADSAGFYDNQGTFRTAINTNTSAFTKMVINVAGNNDRVRFDFSANGFFQLSRGTFVATGTGTDTLLVSGNANYALSNSKLIAVNKTQINLTGTERANIQGGQSANRLDARTFTGTTILDGGAGNDTLLGGSGRNILIGGLGVDAIFGGAKDDILIGGRTTLNIFSPSFTPLVDKWASTLPYASRVAQIRVGSGLPAGVKLSPAKVPSDGARDTLTGAGGLDWFWAYADDLLKDKTANEQLR